MSDNLFFQPSQLRRIGSNVIIGKTVRIRYPELVEIGDNVIIDDFTYISTALTIDNNVHIAAGCKLIGGRNSTVTIGEFSTLAPNVVLAAGSDDYIAGIASPLVPLEYKGAVQIGTIRLGRHCIIGANSTVLPDITLHDGAAIGAQSLVKSDVPNWELHAGVPARYLKARNREEILRLEQIWRSKQT
ncbi:acyltransferase [Limnobacter sp.]|uniref:acyltransferase n=1 Tax=Limnobacter sp. TaxID=2003368 RepID=UPI002FDF2F16